MPLRTRKEEPLALNMTPMVDVVFTLIIFFMVGAKFTDEQRELGLKLPSVGQAAVSVAVPRTRTIAIRSDGGLFLDDEPVTLESLGTALTSDHSSGRGRIMIRGDANVPFQRVAAVLSAAKGAGIQDLAVAVRIETVQR